MRPSLLSRFSSARAALNGVPPINRPRAFSGTERAFCSDAHQQDGAAAKKRPRAQSDVRTSSRSDGPFVSKFYKLDPFEVQNYMKRNHVAYRKSGRHVCVKECPFCHPIMDDPTNMYKLYVLTSNGLFHCHRCKTQGSWLKLRRQISGVSSEAGEPPIMGSGELGMLDGEQSDDEASTGGAPSPPRSSLQRYQEMLNVHQKDMKKFIRNERGLNADVLEKYGVGLGKSWFYDAKTDIKCEELCYMFPMFSSHRKLVRYKVRAVGKKQFMKLDPKGGAWGLFGMQALPAGAKEVVLTEGEFDAMAVYQATGRPALSLPNGASSLPVSVVKMLERFKKIYLWMDDDIPGQQGARQFAKKLGRKRCLSVSTENKAKDANDALLKGLDLEAMIRNAAKVPHDGVATFKDFRTDVYNQIMNPEQLQGIQSQMLPGFNNVLKGHRRGELTIFSGHTGTGKTSLLSQLSLDYCAQGQPTLWGSFEIPNANLAKLLLQQLYAMKTGQPVSTLPDHFTEWAERFEELPMFFLRYFGSQPIDMVIDAMEYGHYVHDIAHVVLDNLQFMTSGQARPNAGAYGRFEVMDDAMQRLRAFSTERNVHVSLVVHPRKEDDNSEIQTSSIFGSAKATQEADSVIILQKGRGNGRVLEVRKNRFDGTQGRINIAFDKELKLFKERKNHKTEQRHALPKTPTTTTLDTCRPLVMDRLQPESSW